MATKVSHRIHHRSSLVGVPKLPTAKAALPDLPPLSRLVLVLELAQFFILSTFTRTEEAIRLYPVTWRIGLTAKSISSAFLLVPHQDIASDTTATQTRLFAEPQKPHYRFAGTSPHKEEISSSTKYLIAQA